MSKPKAPSKPSAPKKTPPVDKAPTPPAADPSAALQAPSGAPDTSAAGTGAPAPDTTQKNAGAGEAQDKQPDPAKPDPVVTHFHIAALTDGFRRCGRAWPAAGVEVAVGDLAEGDLDRLRAESELVVTPVTKAAE